MSQPIFSVLTIDGGGVRGIVAATLLSEIEKRTGQPISKLFDLIAGSSTGAILAVGLSAPSDNNPNQPRYSAETMKEFYIKYISEIFPPNKYRQLKHLMPVTNGFFDDAPFERILNEHLESLSLKDALTSVMVAGADMKNFRPEWMQYIKTPGEKKVTQRWESLKMADAVRASASAPTIFKAKYIQTYPNLKLKDAPERHAFLDGSLFASIVTRSALTEAKALAPKGARIIIASVGTGSLRPNLTPDEINRMHLLEWVNNDRGGSIMNVSMELTMRAILDDVRKELGDDLFRFNAIVDPDAADSPDMSLINSRSENLQKLVQLAEKIIAERDEEIDRLCAALIDRLEYKNLLKKSGSAFDKISSRMLKFNTIKELNSFYTDVVKFRSGICEQDMTSEQTSLQDLCVALTPEHYDTLENIYKAQVQSLTISSQSEIKNKDDRSKKKGFWQNFNILSGKKANTKTKARNDNAPRNQKPKKKHYGSR